jgi:hypothetical protein
MLHSMQEAIAGSSPQTANGFAELLASLAAAKPTELPAWNDEELSQDVATLSYDGALRAHARYKAADEKQPDAAPSEHERKCASVTLRMSKAECEQLRVRAAEAGLTVSAYLRLCAFEADSLRAQVKGALAELRRTPTPEAITANNGESSRGSRRGWLRRMMPDLHPARN